MTYTKEQYLQNKTNILNSRKLYYHENRDRIIERQINYQKNNEAYKAYQKEYQKKYYHNKKNERNGLTSN